MHRVRSWANRSARPSGAPAVRLDQPHNAGADPALGQEGPATAGDSTPGKKTMVSRFRANARNIIFASWLNVLLVFVPVGIAVHFAHMSAGIVFAMNAIAIIPLAGLLSHATESVASRMGDTIGALMNVTFGNAVELIIFIIGLVKNEIRIVQAAILGSILSNLLLILGMAFFLGGLRYREQIYNSTVTQVSACLLSLTVISLLLPTAFHASFSDLATANYRVLQVSRGVSVILLLVYILYLVFQLNSHAYLYESTPLHIIEREAFPGPVAGYFDSSDSSSDSPSVSDSDSSSSDGTRKRLREAVRKRRAKRQKAKRKGGAEDDADGVSAGEALAEATAEAEGSQAQGTKTRRSGGGKQATKAAKAVEEAGITTESSHPAIPSNSGIELQATAHANVESQTTTLGPIPFLNLRPIISKAVSQSVFAKPPPGQDASMRPAPRQDVSLRRTRSLPTHRGQNDPLSPRGSAPPLTPVLASQAEKEMMGEEGSAAELSRSAAIVLLLIATGFVALCAEFMVDSINEVVASNSGISEAFIGLILLPIVGNAAEHVTAVSVAIKNKMDLAIGVALGSSIQIAIFVSPLIVLLGWMMGKNMSLYFTLFETVSMFASAFIVNFLVLDGRSNYLEGALLVAAYIIIAVAAFFYPSNKELSLVGGGKNETAEAAASVAVRGLAHLAGL